MVRRDSVGRQLGLGFGKGRRVIKTILCGDALQAALARQRDWCQRHGVEEAAPLRMAKAQLKPAVGTLNDTDNGRRVTLARGACPESYAFEPPETTRHMTRKLTRNLTGDPLASYTE